ncbi:MAG TPA: hypothetical protein VFO07_16925, partial [Roseiflexaceae bacterium]|nr:hypothetical protein [Roseiflexaceae bacterium]
HYLVRARVCISRGMREQARADARQALKHADKAHLRRQAGELLHSIEQLPLEQTASDATLTMSET